MTRGQSGRFAVRAEAARVIRAARTSAGLSQTELGLRMDTQGATAAQQVVHRVESGKGSMESVMNAAAALGIPFEDVIEYLHKT